MALNKEIWAPTIVENLFAADTFAARAVNHSSFVDNAIVHVPNAGSKPVITIDGTAFPGTPTKRTDVDLNYTLNVFRSEPILIQNSEEVELSYDKRSSVVMNSRNALTEAVHAQLLTNWVSSVKSANKVTAETFGKTAIMDVKLTFDKADIAQQGRCMVLTPEAYNQLLEELTSAEQYSFSASANAATGIVGQFLGFDFYMRSTIDNTSSNKTSAFAWHQDCVSRALGATKLFINEDDPTYYGTILSAEVRAGGSAIRNDGAGIALVKTA